MTFGIRVVRKLDTEKERNKIPKDSNGVRCEDGIEYSRYMWHPTCPFCGLIDLGKNAPERPTEIHMLECEARMLTILPSEQQQVGTDEQGKPIFKNMVVRGSFIGQAFQRQLRYPIRRVFKFKPPDSPKEIWICHYMWKTNQVVDWVWTKEGWKPWFQFSKRKST